ncbi:hypothetical protein NM688_g2797 [Phlebia brevispora]|uniref:Uncharacterized protein n=1 Tax=Phlebia brevispora TaxID=194682 RepID=A0ACC1T7S0_9APHY|nr:hypothetical protein NM688_g2797 [Phlebia brevispora]
MAINTTDKENSHAKHQQIDQTPKKIISELNDIKVQQMLNTRLTKSQSRIHMKNIKNDADRSLKSSIHASRPKYNYDIDIDMIPAKQEYLQNFDDFILLQFELNIPPVLPNSPRSGNLPKEGTEALIQGCATQDSLQTPDNEDEELIRVFSTFTQESEDKKEILDYLRTMNTQKDYMSDTEDSEDSIRQQIAPKPSTSYSKSSLDTQKLIQKGKERKLEDLQDITDKTVAMEIDDPEELPEEMSTSTLFNRPSTPISRIRHVPTIRNGLDRLNRRPLLYARIQQYQADLLAASKEQESKDLLEEGEIQEPISMQQLPLSSESDEDDMSVDESESEHAQQPPLLQRHETEIGRLEIIQRMEREDDAPIVMRHHHAQQRIFTRYPPPANPAGPSNNPNAWRPHWGWKNEWTGLPLEDTGNLSEYERKLKKLLRNVPIIEDKDCDEQVLNPRLKESAVRAATAEVLIWYQQMTGPEACAHQDACIRTAREAQESKEREISTSGPSEPPASMMNHRSKLKERKPEMETISNKFRNLKLNIEGLTERMDEIDILQVPSLTDTTPGKNMYQEESGSQKERLKEGHQIESYKSKKISQQTDKTRLTDDIMANYARGTTINIMRPVPTMFTDPIGRISTGISTCKGTGNTPFDKCEVRKAHSHFYFSVPGHNQHPIQVSGLQVTQLPHQTTHDGRQVSRFYIRDGVLATQLGDKAGGFTTLTTRVNAMLYITEVLTPLHMYSSILSTILCEDEDEPQDNKPEEGSDKQQDEYDDEAKNDEEDKQEGIKVEDKDDEQTVIDDRHKEDQIEEDKGPDRMNVDSEKVGDHPAPSAKDNHHFFTTTPLTLGTHTLSDDSISYAVTQTLLRALTSSEKLLAYPESDEELDKLDDDEDYSVIATAGSSAPISVFATAVPTHSNSPELPDITGQPAPITVETPFNSRASTVAPKVIKHSFHSDCNPIGLEHALDPVIYDNPAIAEAEARRAKLSKHLDNAACLDIADSLHALTSPDICDNNPRPSGTRGVSPPIHTSHLR